MGSKRSLGSGLIYITLLYLSVALLIFIVLQKLESQRNVGELISDIDAPTMETSKSTDFWDLDNTGFRNISKSLFIFSTFLDSRRFDDTFIRIMALETRALPLNKTCIIQVGDETLETPLIQYDTTDDHGLISRPLILSCRIPSRPTTRLPIRLHINLNSGPTAPFSVSRLIPEINRMNFRYNFTVCLHSPLHGSRYSARYFMEFVELSRLLGADHFLLYYLKEFDNDEFKLTLEFYANQGIVTTIPFKNPVANSVWYKGQMLLIQDCLYKTMGLSRFTVFNDLDEYLIPQQPSQYNWFQLVDSAWSAMPNACGFSVGTAFFPVRNESEYQESGIPFKITQRVSYTDWISTKCIVRPELIFEMGIHHMSKQYLEHLVPEHMNESWALIHHYYFVSPTIAKVVAKNRDKRNYTLITSDIIMKYENECNRNFHGQWLNFRQFQTAVND